MLRRTCTRHGGVAPDHKNDTSCCPSVLNGHQSVDSCTNIVCESGTRFTLAAMFDLRVWLRVIWRAAELQHLFSVLSLHVEESLQTQHMLAFQRHELRAGHPHARRCDAPAVRLEAVQQRLSLRWAAAASACDASGSRHACIKLINSVPGPFSKRSKGSRQASITDDESCHSCFMSQRACGFREQQTLCRDSHTATRCMVTAAWPCHENFVAFDLI